jgi:cyclic pyranopterin phosphate synthase
VGELRVSEAAGTPSARLVDTFGRAHRDLRVSVTDRCNLRCTYCMPADFAEWLPGDHLLTVDELVEVVDVAVGLGVTNVRLTGGEPTLRPDLVDLVARIAGLPNAPRMSLTSNGLRLAKLAGPLAAAGLERVNVSLDTLDADRFSRMTFRDRHADVLAGIEAALAAGLRPVKVNAVLMRGVNDDEAVPLLRHAIAHGWHLRFIEQMPLDPSGIWSRTKMVTAEEIVGLLSAHVALTPADGRGSAPAEEFLVDGGPATVGIVGSVTRPFCAACDRLRLTADGQVLNCLFSRDETDVRAVLRDPALTPDERRERIGGVLASSVAAKRAGHGIDDPTFIHPTRPMSAIGG